MFRTQLSLSLGVLTAVASLAVPASAQFGAPPAKELAKFDALLGSWEGSGEVFMQAGGEPMKWTGEARYTKALNGYFIREDTTIEFGMGSMSMIGFFGWDAETKQFRQFGVTSMGEVNSAPVDWPSARTMCTSAVHRAPNMMTQQAERTMQRWTSMISEDGSTMKMLGEKAVDAGEWFKHVTGSFKKSKTEGRAVNANAAGMMPAPAEMKSFAKLRGLYDIKGTMTMAPGASMPISGNERMEPIFDGHVMSMRVIGDPAEGMPADAQYEGLAYCSWNKIKGCYDMIQVSNMGEMAFMQLRRVGKHYAGTWSGTVEGLPQVKHTVLQCNDEGQMTGVKTWQINGAGKPFVGFEATYSMRK